ncbi:phosphonate ABC transporter ATP-binding protein [Salirhabdus sp. Marseille-P4669]|uniref:phosphonate ABC transporter ATP-binding protein n=1 Tax=Salirhabdus sp. Marseille-P4669 TaxID=2042310 RepID=UPI000C7D297D|nr:phosphonate ABC transporter ATP-binding protein [Salirhabdus sp. Marseille-P4669]
MLVVDNLSVRYFGSKDNAISNISLTFQQGEFICILGKSGAGKSTFIRSLNGLQTPTSGDIFWEGKQISNQKEEELRKIRREMGMIFQHFNLIPRLSVLQNVLTGLAGYRSSVKNMFGIFTAEEKKAAEQVIAEVGLKDYIHQRVEHLSGGQKQRVGIARALLQRPKVLLGDEPVSSLDPGISNRIFTLIKELHERHQLLTIINVHDVELAKRFATRIISFSNGNVIFDGSPEQFNEKIFHITYQ